MLEQLQDDGALLSEHLEGRTEAFEALYRRFHPRLCRYLARITDPGLAEDLAQETLARVLEHADALRTDRPLWPWLKAVALRLAIDAARKRSREVIELPSEDVPHWDDHRLLEERPVLRSALAALTPEQRDAIRLRYVDEWEMADAAASMGLSGTAFKQSLYRARQRLRIEYSRLTETALLLPPIQWLRRRTRPVVGRAKRAAGRLLGDASFSPESAHQVAVGVAASLLLVAGVPPALHRPPVARGHAVPSVEHTERTSFAADARNHGTDPDSDPDASRPPAGVTAADEEAPAGRPSERAAHDVVEDEVEDLTDPNHDVEQPEETRVVHISAAQPSAETGEIYAIGTGRCNETLCHPVLFRSPDRGATWTRLPAAGLMADTLILPPSFGAGDARMFAMGQEGLQVSEDGGASFSPAAIGGGPHAAGPAAMSPAFDSGDPSILIGARTLVRYRDDLRTTEPVATTAAPTPMTPAYSPAYGSDRTVFLGAVSIDPLRGTVSVVHRCVDGICSPAPLEGQQVVPELRVPADFGATGRLYAFTDEALFVSSDRGATFQEVARGWSAEMLWDVAVAGDTLVASTLPHGDGGPGGLYISGDAGATWRAVDDPLFARGATMVAVVGDRLIAGLAERGVACSVDGGDAWAPRCAA